MIEVLYQQVCAYEYFASKFVQLDYHTFTLDEVTKTQIEWIHEIQRLCEQSFQLEYIDDERTKCGQQAWKIWAEILPSMWW
jgi:hypothetical protein